MKKKAGSSTNGIQKGPGIISLLTPYRKMMFALIFFALLSNGINLILPKIIANGIDAWPKQFALKKVLISYLGAAIVIFIFTFLVKTAPVSLEKRDLNIIIIIISIITIINTNNIKFKIRKKLQSLKFTN